MLGYALRLLLNEGLLLLAKFLRQLCRLLLHGGSLCARGAVVEVLGDSVQLVFTQLCVKLVLKIIENFGLTCLTGLPHQVGRRFPGLGIAQG